MTGERALSWVRERNAQAVAELTGGCRFEALRAEILEVYDSTDRISYISRRGEYRYNFWRDREHPAAGGGAARSPSTGRSGRTGRSCSTWTRWPRRGRELGLPRCAVPATGLPARADLAVTRRRGRGGGAGVRHRASRVRPDGFQLPAAKSLVCWIDADRSYVATDFGPGTLTTSGYPRTVRQWRRGTPLAEAELVYEGKPDDVSVSAFHDDTEGFEATYPAGCLLVADFDEFMAHGAAGAGLRVLFTPDEHTTLAGYSWTRHHLILDVMHDVVSHLSVLTPAQDWRAMPLTGTPPLCTVGAWGTDPDTDDEYLLDVDGFLTPSTLAIGTIGAGPAVALKRAPAFFDGAGLAVHQHFAVSVDGTRIPYFVVAPDSAVPPGGWPTLLYGYGGFEVSLQPGYDGTSRRFLPSSGNGGQPTQPKRFEWIHNLPSVMYGCGMVMRRFQILLDEPLDDALARQAELESVSKAELLRRYARERLEPLPPMREDPLWELVGVDDADDDPGGTLDIDEIVYGGRR